MHQCFSAKEKTFFSFPTSESGADAPTAPEPTDVFCPTLHSLRGLNEDWVQRARALDKSMDYFTLALDVSAQTFTQPSGAPAPCGVGSSGAVLCTCSDLLVLGKSAICALKPALGTDVHHDPARKAHDVM